MYFRRPDALIKSARFEVAADKKEVFKRAITVLNSSKIKIGRLSLDDGVIVAKRSTSWRSWGEIVSIKIVELETKRTIIEIESCPVEPGRILDYGASRRNIYEFQKRFLDIA